MVWDPLPVKPTVPPATFTVPATAGKAAVILNVPAMRVRFPETASEFPALTVRVRPALLRVRLFVPAATFILMVLAPVRFTSSAAEVDSFYLQMPPLIFLTGMSLLLIPEQVQFSRLIMAQILSLTAIFSSIARQVWACVLAVLVEQLRWLPEKLLRWALQDLPPVNLGFAISLKPVPLLNPSY